MASLNGTKESDGWKVMKPTEGILFIYSENKGYTIEIGLDKDTMNTISEFSKTAATGGVGEMFMDIDNGMLKMTAKFSGTTWNRSSTPSAGDIRFEKTENGFEIRATLGKEVQDVLEKFVGKDVATRLQFITGDKGGKMVFTLLVINKKPIEPRTETFHEGYG